MFWLSPHQSFYYRCECEYSVPSFLHVYLLTVIAYDVFYDHIAIRPGAVFGFLNFCPWNLLANHLTSVFVRRGGFQG